MKSNKIMKRFRVVSVPNNDGSEATWFVYDTQNRTSFECEDMEAALDCCAISNERAGSHN